MQPEKIQSLLIKWFRARARNLPWRVNRTPYTVLISEIMLQQTQVDTVVPYFLRFMQKWPSLQDLAQAPLDDLLKQWQGLGYYSRARNLHRAAKQIVADYAGEIPSEKAALLDLPGIGLYSAGAILSMAYNVPEPAIDGNVRRVLARLLAQKFEASAKTTALFLEKHTRKLISQAQPGLFNEALMELGATVCKPREPRCTECPLREDCLGFQSGQPQRYPTPLKKPTVRDESVDVLIIRCNDRYLISRNPDRGLWGGLWIFPMCKRPKKAAAKSTRHLIQHIKKDFSIPVKAKTQLPAFLHRFTHIHMRLHPYLFAVTGSPAQRKTVSKAAQFKWVKEKDLESYAFPRPYQTLIETLKTL